MDWLMTLGAGALIGIGIIGRTRPDLLWRLYSLEPRWRKDNPEQPKNWKTKAHKQGYFMIGFGIFSIILAYLLG
jgi:hypothetical protein